MARPWTQEDDIVIIKSGGFYPDRMGSVSASISNRHDVNECIRRYQELKGLPIDPVVQEEPPIQILKKPGFNELMLESLGGDVSLAREYREVVSKFLKQHINAEDFLKATDHFGLTHLLKDFKKSLNERHSWRTRELEEAMIGEGGSKTEGDIFPYSVKRESFVSNSRIGGGGSKTEGDISLSSVKTESFVSKIGGRGSVVGESSNEETLKLPKSEGGHSSNEETLKLPKSEGEESKETSDNWGAGRKFYFWI
ncbi:unnamed protein product [Cochlearia groenlandica]